MKSQKECHEALCEGKTLIYKTGSKIKYNAAGMIICKRIGAKNWKEDAFPFTIPGDWEIYEEPSATYDEAAKAKVVKIHWPLESFHTEPQDYVKADGWTELELGDFDLAERRGYRMEVVE